MKRDKPRDESLELAGLDEQEQLVLSDLVNRVLDKGLVINSHIVISVADVDLIELDLKLLLSSAVTLVKRGVR